MFIAFNARHSHQLIFASEPSCPRKLFLVVPDTTQRFGVLGSQFTLLKGPVQHVHDLNLYLLRYCPGFQDRRTKQGLASSHTKMTTVDDNLGPLTITFTPPSDCNLISVQIDSFTFSSKFSEYYNLFMYNLDWVSAQRCFPPGYLTNKGFGWNDATQTAYFSPGLCPCSWGSYQVMSTVEGESSAMCCPPGFVPSGISCSATISAATTVTAVVIAGTDYSPSPGKTFNYGTSTNFVIPGDRSFYVNPLNVRYHSSDLSLITPASATATQSALTTSNVNSSTTPTPTSVFPNPTATPSSGGNGFTEDQKIALGVGLGMGLPAIVLAALGVYYAARRRR
jgi:hypothetical protein